jgi:hypothetical protein
MPSSQIDETCLNRIQRYAGGQTNIYLLSIVPPWTML